MGFLDETTASDPLDEQGRFSLHLVVEELFANMVEHNPEASAEIMVRVDRLDDRLEVRLVEDDAHFFDPTAHPEPDVSAPLGQRRPGGLGLHLVRHFSDGLRYEREGRRNIVIVTKNLNDLHASD